MIVRSIGEMPTEQKLREVEEMFGKGNGGVISFEDFEKVVVKIRNECKRASAQDLEEAFRKLDSEGKGVISVTELKRLLTTMGEPLDETEVDAMLAEASIQDGMVDYVKLAKKLVL